MKKEFYSNGKLLITAEYLVLDGAKALALPTKFGQSLVVETTNNSQIISWKSFDLNGECWFETDMNFKSIIDFNFDSKHTTIKDTLLRILKEGYQLSPKFLSDKTKGFQISTNLNFPKDWGLGTSSTLINNVAQWLQIDAFDLLHKSFGGSGYDIACAQSDSAITYQLVQQTQLVTKVAFAPNFLDKIYFVYLNKKQNSKTAIENYRSKKLNLVEDITEISKITEAVLNANVTLHEFKANLKTHEALVSSIIELPTVQELFFNDFDGVVKSLGAWGGDFVMVISEESPKAYFKNKGYETILRYQEMILI